MEFIWTSNNILLINTKSISGLVLLRSRQLRGLRYRVLRATQWNPQELHTCWVGCKRDLSFISLFLDVSRSVSNVACRQLPWNFNTFWVTAPVNAKLKRHSSIEQDHFAIATRVRAQNNSHELMGRCKQRRVFGNATNQPGTFRVQDSWQRWWNASTSSPLPRVPSRAPAAPRPDAYQHRGPLRDPFWWSFPWLVIGETNSALSAQLVWK